MEVDYATADATAASGEDYGVRSGTLSFQPGETSHTVSVPIAGDLLGEGDETFLLSLSAPVHATLGEGTATIRDDDEVGVTIGEVIRTEGDAGTTDCREPLQPMHFPKISLLYVISTRCPVICPACFDLETVGKRASHVK